MPDGTTHRSARAVDRQPQAVVGRRPDGVVTAPALEASETRARQALSEKVFRKDVIVRVSDTDRYGRLIGEIWLGDRDINRELIREGYAWAYRDYLTDRTLLDDEAHAKDEGIGLWSEPDPVPPWRWRRGDRSAAVSSQSAKAFTCGSKTYCREMTSCDEAMFYLRECGLTRLDGDSDGVPCESICR